jgi:16S rRNA processing protein RimM
MAQEEFVVMGRIAGLYGVKGWVKVFSETEPRDNILEYSPWYLKISGNWVEMEPAEGRIHGNGVVARMEGYTDRDQAARLVGVEIAIHRDQLPEIEDGEYYWSDLIGLKVVNTAGVELGQVDHLLETGANDVLIVKGERERLIPYTPGQAVVKVDLEAGLLTVEWDADF